MIRKKESVVIKAANVKKGACDPVPNFTAIYGDLLELGRVTVDDVTTASETKYYDPAPQFTVTYGDLLALAGYWYKIRLKRQIALFENDYANDGAEFPYDEIRCDFHRAGERVAAIITALSDDLEAVAEIIRRVEAEIERNDPLAWKMFEDEATPEEEARFMARFDSSGPGYEAVKKADRLNPGSSTPEGTAP